MVMHPSDQLVITSLYISKLRAQMLKITVNPALLIDETHQSCASLRFELTRFVPGAAGNCILDGRCQVD
jgi:hypothetical protein